MPLSMATIGETNCIRQVNGKEDTKRFLESLGFIAGCSVSIVSKISGNIIVKVKETRIAISSEMASKIII